MRAPSGVQIAWIVQSSRFKVQGPRLSFKTFETLRAVLASLRFHQIIFASGNLKCSPGYDSYLSSVKLKLTRSTFALV